MNNYERIPLDATGSLEDGLISQQKAQALHHDRVTDFVNDLNDTTQKTPKGGAGYTIAQRCRSNLGSALYFLNSNAGLLLVASSQAFFAAMNTAVKKLNSLDPPVSALEVGVLRLRRIDLAHTFSSSL